MMVRLVSCGVRECRRALIDQERHRHIINKMKEEQV
jgi:hypothetical protein